MSGVAVVPNQVLNPGGGTCVYTQVIVSVPASLDPVSLAVTDDAVYFSNTSGNGYRVGK